MRDERYRPGGASLSPIEITFVIIATAATIAFGVWFLFFAGSPLE